MHMSKVKSKYVRSKHVKTHCVKYRKSSNFLVWKFFENVKIDQNSEETVSFHKISAPGN